MTVKSAVIIQKEENLYVATDTLSGVALQGKTTDESFADLKEALELYYENDIPENDTSFNNEQISILEDFLDKN